MLKKNKKKLTLLLFISLLGLSNLPFWLATPQGLQFSQALLLKQSKGEAQIEDVNLTWLGPQKISAIHYHPSTDHPRISLENIVIEDSLPLWLYRQSKLYLGKFNWLGKKWKSELIISQLSTKRAAKWLKLEEAGLQTLTALFGESLDIKGELASQGDGWEINFKFNSKNSHFEIDGHLSPLLLLTLRSPVIISVAPENINGQILTSLFPLVGDQLHLKTGWRAHINPEGFALPLSKFNLSKLEISKGKIELGKIEVNNEAPLASLLRQFGLDTKKALEIWLAPMEIAIREGKLTIRRTDFLAMERYPCALWGDINLTKNQLDLKLGLSSKIAGKALARNLLGKREFIVLPIKCREDCVKIDGKRIQQEVIAEAASRWGGYFKERVDPIPPREYDLPWEGS